MEQKMQKVSNTQKHVAITTLSDNRVISLLQEALSLLNNQCEELEKANASKGDQIIELKGKLSSKDKEIDILNKEKNNVCQDKEQLSKQFDQLRLEKNNIIKELESAKDLINDSKQSLSNEKENIKKMTQSNEELQKQIDALNELISQKDSEIDNKNQKINECSKANEDLSGEFCSLQKAKEVVDKRLKEMFLYPIYSIKGDVEKCLTIPSVSSEWSQYLNEIIDSINSLHSKTDTEEVIEELLHADSALCKLVSILWWSCQNEMKAELSAQIPFLNEILSQTASLLNFISLFGYNIIVPKGDYRNQIDNYALYPNGYSRISKLFPTTKFESRYKCEVYLLAYNDNTGKCYSNELK